MPTNNGDVQGFAQPRQPPPLVINQRLERADINDQAGGEWLLKQMGQNGEEGGFSLSGRRGRGHNDVTVSVDKGRDGPFLSVS